MHNMPQPEQQLPLRQQEQEHAPRPSSPSLSAHRKQLKFYMEVAVLLMVSFMLIASVLKSLLSGTDVPTDQLSHVLRLVNNIGQGLPLVGAVTECQNGTRC